MLQENSKVICTYSKIKEGHLDDVRNWFQTLLDRKEETLESFRNEGVKIESAFIKKINGDYFLIYYMVANDVKEATDVFRKSTLPIDSFHKKCFEDFIEQSETLNSIFHLEIPSFRD